MWKRYVKAVVILYGYMMWGALPLAAAVETDAYSPTDMRDQLTTLLIEQRFVEAEKLAVSLVTMAQEDYGVGDYQTVPLLNRLADVYISEMRYEAAEWAYGQVLTISENMLGSQHPELVAVLHNLAVVENHLKRYPEAVELLEQAKMLVEGQYGPDFSYVATLLSSLADNYDRIGKSNDARLAARRAYEIFLKQLGAKHPDTIRAAEMVALFDAGKRDREKSQTFCPNRR